ncbi:MAG: bifunctional hydroxymethylpyrimidine kinase/phosphomethylpyrimidine kinase [Acidobacteria bacterium]|nr:bifunctional hydroxymethylpyrimidine kinase/phosphomethylpyrimidine kinase [Acidobacteriota bacterium]
MRVVISIAGFDPSGGAGTLADVKTFAAFGVFGAAAVTSLTSQNTLAVYGAFHQTADVVRAQIEPVLEDYEIAAVKIGMLATLEVIDAVADIVGVRRLPHVVLDPVIRSTSGYDLIDDRAAVHLRDRLMPLAEVVTPNLAEAERLTGMRVRTIAEMESAGRRLREMGARAVLVKGGHLLNEANDEANDEAVDLLVDDRGVQRFASPRVETGSTHGTGCTLSSAIAAMLARGADLPEAVSRSKQYLVEALRAAPGIGRGAGPLNHGVSVEG